jgi:Leucine-rich repeat (LRR) protein
MLTNLDLGYCWSLGGHLPAEFYNLTSLTSFSIYNDVSFTPTISTLIGRLSMLRTIRFGAQVGIQGTIPTQFYSLANLSYLDIDPFIGVSSISTLIGQLTSLTALSVSGTVGASAFPSQLGHCSALTSLSLSARFFGAVPTQYSRLTRLVAAALTSTNGSNVFVPLAPTLTSLVLSGLVVANYSSIAAMSQLNKLSLNLAGRVDGALLVPLTALTKLVTLQLIQNELNASMFSEIGLFASVRALDLSSNLVPWTLPSELANLTALTYLRVTSSQLIGSVPTWLAQLSSLSYLDLSGNSLVGAVPLLTSKLTTSKCLLQYNTTKGNCLDVYSPVCQFGGGLCQCDPTAGKCNGTTTTRSTATMLPLTTTSRGSTTTSGGSTVALTTTSTLPTTTTIVSTTLLTTTQPLPVTAMPITSVAVSTSAAVSVSMFGDVSMVVMSSSVVVAEVSTTMTVPLSSSTTVFTKDSVSPATVNVAAATSLSKRQSIVPVAAGAASAAVVCVFAVIAVIVGIRRCRKKVDTKTSSDSCKSLASYSGVNTSCSTNCTTFDVRYRCHDIAKHCRGHGRQVLCAVFVVYASFLIANSFCLSK